MYRKANHAAGPFLGELGIKYPCDQYLKGIVALPRPRQNGLREVESRANHTLVLTPGVRMYELMFAASLAISCIALLVVMGLTADYLYHR